MKDAWIMSDYFGTFFSEFQCGFRQGLLIIEKWKKSMDKGKTSGLLLTDLSKAFDCLLHDLIITKLMHMGLV